MTHLVSRLSPPNSLVLVLDPDTGDPPDTMGDHLVSSTASGLAVGTLAEFDGETEIHLCRADDLPAKHDLTMEWTGTLTTAGRLGVLNIYNEVLMEIEVPSPLSVQVWTNHASEPDVIWVVVES